jgi:thiamine-phosphate pyrophosphorylase
VASLAELARRLKPPARQSLAFHGWEPPRGRQTPGVRLPALILMTDAVRLPDPTAAMADLPRGAVVILRHPDDKERRRLARRLAAPCRRLKLRLLIAGDTRLAAGAGGLHLSEAMLRHGGRGWHLLRRPGWLVTAAAHSPWAIRAAVHAGVDAVLLSPVFPTASHPGAAALGPLKFARLARQSPIPVYALGGVTTATAPRLAGSGGAGFAAIGGLVPPAQSSFVCSPWGARL